MIYERIVTVFGLGYTRFMPGTFGSLIGLLIGILLYFIGKFLLLFISTIILFFVGWWLVKLYVANKTRSHDPSEVIIDEVVGQLIALFPIFYGTWLSNDQLLSNNLLGFLSAFLLFRFFDIFKPWPINLADQMTNSLGVMLDDVLAGICTLIIIILINFMF